MITPDGRVPTARWHTVSGMTRRAPRITFAGWQLGDYGGMETRVVAAAQLARSHGFEVAIRTARPIPEGSRTEKALRDFDVESVIGGWERTSAAAAAMGAARVAATLRARRRLTPEEQASAAHRLRQRQTDRYWLHGGSEVLERTDVLHLFGTPASFLVGALEAARDRSVPAIYQSVHAVTADYAADAWRQPFAGACNLLDTILISHELQGAGFAAHFGYRGRTEVIEQWAFGVEADLLAIPEVDPQGGSDGPVFATLCRLDPVKGLDTLIRAFAAAATALPGARLVIGGTGEIDGELRRLARELGVADRVDLLGFVEDRPAFYRSADVVVIASRAEGGPIIGVEAMAAARPIVSTRVGAMEERLTGGVGVVVEVDDVAAMSAAFIELGTSSPLRGQLSTAVRARYLERCAQSVQERRLVETWNRMASSRGV